MKKISIFFTAPAIAIVLLASACSKKSEDGPTPGIDVIGVMEGFLSTKTGVPTGNLGDTAYIRMKGSANTGGGLQVADTYAGGKHESKDWYMKIEASGNNYVYVRNILDGYYLGFNPSVVVSGNHPWGKNWASVDKTPGPRNKFTIKKKGDHFTLECFEYKGLFLNATLPSQISYAGPQTVQELHFIEKEQEWFFLKPF